MKKGFKSREIALELGISQKTVSTYINRIKTKLNVSRDANQYKLVCEWIKAVKEQREQDILESEVVL
jgi:DNA-binding NarL/FixJ family response regulator